MRKYNYKKGIQLLLSHRKFNIHRLGWMFRYDDEEGEKRRVGEAKI